MNYKNSLLLIDRNFQTHYIIRHIMELRVLSKESSELMIEIKGENHTFMNVLKGALLETEGVTAATYDLNPIQSGGQIDPILSLKTDGRDPLEALGDATKSIEGAYGEFLKAYQAAVK